MIDVLTFKSRIKAIDLFLDHYFKNIEEWKNGYSTELSFSSKDWEILIYDGYSIYECWNFNEIEDYLDSNNLFYE